MATRWQSVSRRDHGTDDLSMAVIVIGTVATAGNATRYGCGAGRQGAGRWPPCRASIQPGLCRCAFVSSKARSGEIVTVRTIRQTASQCFDNLPSRWKTVQDGSTYGRFGHHQYLLGLWIFTTNGELATVSPACNPAVAEREYAVRLLGELDRKSRKPNSGTGLN